MTRFLSSPLALIALLLAAAILTACPQNGGGSVKAEAAAILPKADAPGDRPVEITADGVAEVVAPGGGSSIEKVDKGAGAPSSKKSMDEKPPPTAAERAAREPSWEQILDPKRALEGAVSVGSTLKGKLKGEARLPLDGAHYTVLGICRERETNFGTEEVIALLTDTAASMAQAWPKGPKLAVCNMAKRGGGNIEWSRSHNSGRDADLAFYVRTKAGEPVEAPHLVRFGRELTSLGDDGAYVFDVERNWALARRLLTHPTIQLQWIFVYNPLKRAMLRHARTLGEPEALLEKAELVLWQPSDSARHNDHFHVRVFCADQDRPEGCLDEIPIWDWVTFDPVPVADRAAALAPGLRERDEETRTRVLDHIERIQALDAAPALAEVAIFDRSNALRLRAMNILVEWRLRDADVAWAVERFVRAPGAGIVKDDPAYTTSDPAAIPWAGVMTRYTIGEGQERDALTLRRAWRVLDKMASPKAGPFLARALKSRRVIGEGAGVSEARLAAEAAIHAMDLRMVPALIDALEQDDNRVRANAHLALRRITNHSAGSADNWRAWWAEKGQKDRDELLMEGFRRGGVRLSSLDDKLFADLLVPLTLRDDEIGYNADRTLARMTGHYVPREASAEEKHKLWSAFVPPK